MQINGGEIHANKHVDFIGRGQHHHKGNVSHLGMSLQDAFPERRFVIPLGKQLLGMTVPLRQKNGTLHQGKDIRIGCSTK